ncbi:Metal tolerance protein 7 [Cyphellophora attinorum]|uniref:Metal tolerance protein 7 n=1 Tax=Cyphellophora attinorum TaxID=1664694 RepID=A0A0N1HHZ5_9EURO|nr:Metal tolerance protein 7 [Phialophora attinorum]KPI45804.1 Metal tolerance protein 7 [Phialophora attinorum]
MERPGPHSFMTEPPPELSQTPHKHYRLGGLSGFVPLNDDQITISTRGQRLPSLIQNRSSTSLFTLNRKPELARLRRNSFHSTDDEETGQEPVHEDDTGPPISPSRTRRMTATSVISGDRDPRRMSLGPEILNTPQMRSMRLIGNSNPRYRWRKYFKSEEELKEMSKPLRAYYERCNYLISHYIYIDKLLDSSLPHDLIQEYSQQHGSALSQYKHDMATIAEEVPTPVTAGTVSTMSYGTGTPTETGPSSMGSPTDALKPKVKRTPKNLYKLPEPSETSPLLTNFKETEDDAEAAAETDKLLEDNIDIELLVEDEGVDANDPVVTVAIYINLVANALLLAGKIAVIVLTDSLSVLASLVDAALDFLSTAIVWITTKLVSHQDQYAYPIGRRRLEPVGVLVFSIIMITSFVQVGLECLNRLVSGDHTIVELSLPSIIIMLSTVLIKGFCYFWCRLVKNSSVQALAQDALTDMVFNTFSIIFPLIGFYARIWWMDALGGLLLSGYVIFNWSKTSSEHVRNLCGAAATADQRNVLLYLTMRFAKTIRYIQGLQAYHAGDKLNVEVDIVLDAETNLRDSHDLGESLQYVLESVPTVDRAFVHADYADWNLPSHMNQQGE